MDRRSIIVRSKNLTHGSASAEKRGLESESPMVSDAFQTSGSSPQSTPSVDLIFENHFSLFLIRPVSPAGQTWLDENVGDENTQTFGGALVCEPRYVEPIMQGAIEAGLAVA
jgi:hypothetical protein